MNPSFRFSDRDNALVKVIGVGGGGCNAVSIMNKLSFVFSGVDEFITCDTDVQALHESSASIKMHIGRQLTRGMGIEANPEMGRKAAMEDADGIRAMLEGADMVFVIAAMGGSTGTGAAPIIADIARKLGILTVGVITKPFAFEGQRRGKQAESGFEMLERSVDTLITIQNPQLLGMLDKDRTLTGVFHFIKMKLYDAVRGISEIIAPSSFVRCDFRDVQIIMGERGQAVMGIGIGSGENGARDAAQKAISSPLLEGTPIERARAILINITGGKNLTLFDVNAAAMEIQKKMHKDANVALGAVIDQYGNKEDAVSVTVIATGFPEE